MFLKDKNQHINFWSIFIDAGDMIFKAHFKTVHTYCEKRRKQGLDDEIEGKDWAEDEDFLKMLTKLFINNIRTIRYKYDVPYSSIFFIKDSPKEFNWRKDIYGDYKGNRKNTIKHKKSNFRMDTLFKYVYHTIFPQLEKDFGVNVIKVDNAEADDTISVIVNSIPDYINVLVLSSDTDFLQLLQKNNIYVYTLNNDALDKKLKGKTAAEMLFYKILTGDKTDNIPACISDSKKAFHYMENPVEFGKLLCTDLNIRNKFDRNRLLIDFSYIPDMIRTNILNAFIYCVNKKIKK